MGDLESKDPFWEFEHALFKDNLRKKTVKQIKSNVVSIFNTKRSNDENSDDVSAEKKLVEAISNHISHYTGFWNSRVRSVISTRTVGKNEQRRIY